jgi:hypothetical protein
MGRFASVVVFSLTLGSGLCAVPVFAGPQEPASGPGALAVAADAPAVIGLRLFTIAKPTPAKETQPDGDNSAAARAHQPPSTDALRVSVGVGYLQGADWGAEIKADGAVAGAQVQLNSLFTQGAAGMLFDQGSLVLFNPDAGWRVEAGDMFSDLRGASRGVLVGWHAAGSRRPTLSVDGPAPGAVYRRTVVSYRDQIVVRSQTLLDAELASDKSYFLKSRLTVGHLNVEASYRRGTTAFPVRDRSVFAGFQMGHGINLTGGVIHGDDAGQPSDWRTVALHVPMSRYFDLTLDRTYAAANQTVNTASGAMFGITAGNLRLFDRYQRGEVDLAQPGLSARLDRQQLQSMASYAPDRRVSFVLQLATQWSETGQSESWEELQTTIKIARGTTLQTVTSVPQLFDTQRLQVRFTQALPSGFAVVAEYGRLSAFQDLVNTLDRSRLRVMLRKGWTVATPAAGGEVRGRVADQTGRAVAGARVKLGEFTADTDAVGVYAFKHVPRGSYDLALDAGFLPADYAWDGREVQLAVTPSSHEHADLLVAPLNAIHGRVYADRNKNGRFDVGEGVAGAVVHLNDQVTVTDSQGAYSFYNLPPGPYLLRLDRERLPTSFELTGSTDLTVALGDDRPVTGADFLVQPRVKPIIWREIIK